MCEAEIHEQDWMTAPITFVKAVTREKLGENTRFLSGTILKDGRIIMSDDKNNRLVQLDENYDIVKEYKIEEKPHAISAGHNANELYLAYNERYVDLCKLDDGLALVRRIETKAGTDGVAACGDNVAVANGMEMDILSQDGTMIQSFPQKGYFCYIATSLTKRTCYYKNKNAIICRTWEGKELFKYKHQELTEPRGICLDMSDNVYVVGTPSDSDENGIVHQISSDGQKGRILLEKLRCFDSPYHIIFNPATNELLITSYNEDTVFEVYKLG